MSKLLVDTNVLIYARDSSSIHHKASVNFLDSENELFLTSKNLSEYYSVVTSSQNPLTKPSEALQDLNELVSGFEILYPSENSRMKLFELISKLQPIGKKIHDFEIASIAIVNNIQRIATFNYKDFKAIEELEIIVPK